MERKGVNISGKKAYWGIMRDKNRLAKIAISLVAAAVLAVRLFKPNLKMDSVVLLLIVIGVVPWLSSLIKSIEFLGFKIEFQESPKPEANAGQGGQQAVNVPAVNPPLVGPAVDAYTTRLLKYTPVELIVGDVIASATVPENATVLGFRMVWILFFTFFALTPIYSRLILKVGVLQTVLMTADFCVWVAAIGGPLSTLPWYQRLYGALGLVIFTFVVPLIDVSRVH